MEYILILVWIGFMALVARYTQSSNTVLAEGIEVKRYSWLFAFIAFVPIIWLAGQRSLDFGDSYNYMMRFRDAPGDFSSIWSYTASAKKDNGFAFLTVLIRIIFGNDYRVCFTVLAAIQGLCVLSVFRKYSVEYVLSLFLFVASADYTWMFNGIRQFTAVCLIFAATSLMIKRKYIPFIIVILLASTLHQSALIMLPFFLIAYGEAWNKRTLIFILFVLFSVVFIGQFTTLLDASLEGTQYSNTVSFFNTADGKGTNPLRVAFCSLPAVFSFVERKKIKEYQSVLINVCVNMSIICAGIYVISMFTSGILIGRLPIYAELYNFLLIPWMIKNVISKKNKKWFIIVMVVIYLLYYYYQMHVAWSVI